MMNFKKAMKDNIGRVLVPIMMWGLLLVCDGCAEKVGVSDEAEREHPDMKKARVLEEAGDAKSARLVYETLLDRSPTLARAHLALALLLDQAGEDQVGAIYHFRRYLALRPDTEKKAMIEGHIRNDLLSLVGTVFTNQAAVLTRMGEVEAENKNLRIKVSNLQAQTVQLRSALTAVRSKYGVVPVPDKPPAPAIELPLPVPISAEKIIKVEPADTLKKMAAKYYGDSGRWREIYEANRKKMRSPGDLRVGQMILIPAP